MLHSTSAYGMQMQTTMQCHFIILKEAMQMQATMQYHFIILKEVKLKSNNIKDLNNVKKMVKTIWRKL